ncbi:uncharacterized protein VICG_01448 [Vittaforma corneae ATCC 50505]|uniref:HMG box domain-containing protein n=1 Tax=Vittaforma corneae (strain ATCC 50505) TaxID=993615 RepID=L2GLE3_VITCO|nr:uncharacterized protein VICG_01448 [Vittaforma corneae ATCC 50505]ELA41464.1 hypothetical protein VICG_01448 [Vittaforma corneae ATCC 50505]
MVKRIKDKNAPKRPLTGFLLYGNYLRASDENIKTLPVTQQATAIAQMWKELNESTKQKYNQQSEKLKEQYKKAMEAYEKSDAYKEFQKTLAEDKSGNSKGAKKKRQGSTKMSGYRLFVKENKDNVDDGLNEEDAGKKHIAKCGMKWKKLSEAERQAYNDRAAQMNPEQLASGDHAMTDDEE